MAGIGFVLRKLTRRGDLTGPIEAFFHAIFASTGPWILTILTMWLFYFVGAFWKLTDYLEEFRAVILYNFSFSLVLTAPLVMASTRFLADRFYENKLSQISSLLIGVLFTQFAISFPIGAFGYLYLSNLETHYALFAIANFLLISAIWLTMVFISSLKYYTAITFSFVLGMGVGLGSAFIFSFYFEQSGLIFGFNVGLGFILTSFIAVILSEYPQGIENVFVFLKSASQYKPVILSGLLYNIGIWVDKWIMWFSPQAKVLESGLRIYPEYDTSMFIAYITIIPAMASFLIVQETSFFESYVRYFRGIMQNDNLRKIHLNQTALAHNYIINGRNILILQGLITFVVITFAPAILEFFNMNLHQLSIFCYGCLGAAFQIFTLFIIIMLSYFDARQSTLYLAIMFAGSNALFTLISLFLGFQWYGVGYFVSMLLSFVYGSYLIEQYLSKLTYHTFVTRNFTSNA